MCACEPGFICRRCRTDDQVDLALEGADYPAWKQDQADIDRERDDLVYEQWVPRDE